MKTALYEWFVIFLYVLYKLTEQIFRLSSRILQIQLGNQQKIGDMELAKIAKNLVKCVSTGENIALESFWQKQACVITFLRRFGWPFCRLSAKQLSLIKPQLDANNVRLVGIGLEEVGLEQFIQGDFFNGELYIDTKKQCYKKLGFKRLNVLSIFPSVLSKSSREALNKAKQENISGDFRGDGFQNGGTLVVAPGGEVLVSYKQENPSDHMDIQEIFRVLGLKEEL